MAKKKNKKNQKAAEWASPPPSPKVAPEEPVPAVPAVPTSLPLSPETAPADSIPDDSAPSLDSPTEPKAVEEPPLESATQEPAVEDAAQTEQKEETSVPKEEEKIEAAPEAEGSASVPDEPVTEVQGESVEQPEPETLTQAPSPEVDGGAIAEAPIEDPPKVDTAPPADDDWGSFAAVSSSKKKKGKKGKKEPKLEEPTLIVEAPEPPVALTETKEEEALPETNSSESSKDQPTPVAEAQVEQAVEPPSGSLKDGQIPPEAPEPPKTEEVPPQSLQTEDPIVDDWTPPSKSSKKSKKKGKKSKDQTAITTPAEEATPVLSEPPEAVEAVPEVIVAPETEVPATEEPSPALEPVIEAQAETSAESAPLSATLVHQEEDPAPDTVKEPEPETETPIELHPETNTPARSEPAPEPQPTSASVEAPPAPEVALAPEAPSPIAVPAEAPGLPTPQPPSPILSPVEAKSADLPISASPIPSPGSPPASKSASPVPPPSAPEPAPASPRSTTTERPPEPSALPKSTSKPVGVNQAIEEDRPPAPTPPITRARPRRAPLYDDDDDDDSALIQPRLRGETLSRDSSRGSYPPSHSRPLFASRVPAEHYSNPPPPPAPPQYHHPRHYPPAAPPYYHAPSHAPSHSHSMSQASGYQGYSPYGPPSHASSPYQESWSHVPPNYGPYNGHSPPQRHDSLGSRDYPPGLPAIENGSAIEDDSGDVFSRIAQAIPDLHVLLARYKETHGQLGVREELLRRASAEQQEKLRVKDEELQTMRDRIISMEHKHSTEASRLRLEVGNMEEQVKELKDQLVETEKFRVEAGQLKVALDSALKSWEGKYKELEEVHTTLEKTSAEELAKTRLEFEEWKTTTTTRNDAEKIALAIQFDKKLKEADVMAESLRQEAAAAYVKEKDELRSEHQRQQREREANFDSLRKELEHKLGASQLDCEQALKRERETMEVWAKERGTLVQAHREDIESLRKSWEEQRSLLEGQHKKIKDESDKAWIELHAEANRKAEENKVLSEQLIKEKEELLKQYNELKLEHEKEKQIIKSVATNLESEKSRLEKLMESYGDIAEIKSKGDTYYLVSFTQLQKQILDLAVTHFVHLPVTPPTEDLQQIPSHIPSFLADTSSSRQLRAAYVAHTVSKLVTYRVFGPFLFSLGRRYDKADSLFLSMSNHIRDKSTRKEAIWRQQTLLAAFTSSGAKQRINTAAGTVVEEIVNAIKHFADPKEEEGIKIAVKRIVKLAAETWRFARLEREMISATMPAVHDEEHEFTGPEFWPSHNPEGTPIPSLVGTTAPSDEKPKLLLRLFPVIYREPKHENFRDSENEKPDEGCIYHYGLALYDDAEPVVQRAEELKAAASVARS